MNLLPEANALIELFKVIALNVVNQSKPVQLVYGTVVSVSPLSVKLDQKRTLDAMFLKKLDYSGSVSISDVSYTANITEFSKGDVVAMLQKQGGQEFLILGKVI